MSSTLLAEVAFVEGNGLARFGLFEQFVGLEFVSIFEKFENLILPCKTLE